MATQKQIYDKKMALKAGKRYQTLVKRYDRQKQAYEYDYQRNLATDIRARFLAQ